MQHRTLQFKQKRQLKPTEILVQTFINWDEQTFLIYSFAIGKIKAKNIKPLERLHENCIEVSTLVTLNPLFNEQRSTKFESFRTVCSWSSWGRCSARGQPCASSRAGWRRCRRRRWRQRCSSDGSRPPSSGSSTGPGFQAFFLKKKWRRLDWMIKSASYLSR